MIRLFAACLLFIGAITGQSSWAVTCHGRFPNPITDICWSCSFPLKISGISITMNQEDNNTSSGGLCMCGTKVGVKFSFWEPVRIVEVVKDPYCFPVLAGMSLPIDVNAGNTGTMVFREGAHGRSSDGGASFYQAHWYTNPIWYWLSIITDNTCIENGVLDLAYFTEVDPLWADSKKTFILNPDASLFANVAAQLACPVDCVAATAGFPLDEVFWCAGCQGSMYPLNGWVGHHYGGVGNSSLLTARMIMKMHREGLVFAGSGSEGLCGLYWDPIVSKSDYKMQMIYPVPNTRKVFGKCCQPLGRTTSLWQAGKEFPVKGESFAYQLFRKRDCCSGGLNITQALPSWR